MEVLSIRRKIHRPEKYAVDPFNLVHRIHLLLKLDPNIIIELLNSRFQLLDRQVGIMVGCDDTHAFQ